MTSPRQAAAMIRAAILRRPELRYKQWPTMSPEQVEAQREYDTLRGNPYLGFCYIATEVFCHMIPEARPWCTMSRSHFWAQIGDEVFDLTIDQFPDGHDHSKGRRTGFKQLSARARALLEETERGSRQASNAA